MPMAMSAPEKAAEETIRASREAVAYFQQFDKANLYHAAAQRSTGWLLGEKAQESETLPRYVPIDGFKLPGEGAGENTYTMFIPRESGSESRPLRLQELNRIVYELLVGIYVFNQVPGISLQPNYDGSSACVIPSAYHDTLVGSTLFEVDYFIKSLLHGTAVPQMTKRERINDMWRRMAADSPSSLRDKLKSMGLVYMIDDPELGHDLYEHKVEAFIRLPPKCVDQELAHSELTPRLTTGEEFDQQEAHVSHDMFLRYLDHVNIGLLFRQRSIQQDGALFILDATYDVTSRVSGNQTEEDSDLYWHLHTYLQKQRSFVAENLRKKKDISRCIALLQFASFMTQFLVTLKQHKKIISLASLHGARSGEAVHTSRELPPALPSETSRWSPFLAQNSYTGLHGEVQFHLLQRRATQPGTEFLRAYQSLKSNDVGTKELPTCKVGGRVYYALSVSIEDFYTMSPKLPRWAHSMISELASQHVRLPSLHSRVQECLRKPYIPRQAAGMKTVPVQLLASVEKGLLPLVALLLKSCTQTHLNKLDDRGRALVHYAATSCQTEVLSALLLAGCIVDQTCLTSDLQPTATQPLHLAARSGGLETVVCLLHFGADVLAMDSTGWTVVHYAAFHNYQAIVLHVCTAERRCLELRTEDRVAATPLLLAARNGGYDTVKCLIDLGADITAKDGSGRGLIHLAALRHQIDILKCLIDLGRPELPVWEELSAMLVADISSGYPQAAARCLDPLSQWRAHVSDHLLRCSIASSLVELIRMKGDVKLQHLAVQVLANVSCSDGIRSALKGTAVAPLTGLLESPSERVQACACIVLCDLGTLPETQASIAQAGAIPPLVKLLGSEADDVQLYSCAALGILADDNVSNQNAIAAASAIPALKSLLISDLSCIQACASSAIQLLVEDNRSCQLSALSHDLLPQLIPLLRSKEVSVHTNAALAIESMAENCEQAQQELLANPTCIALLKRLLKMKDSSVKVASTCALWAIAGSLISNQRLIATHMGLTQLVNMLTIHNEKLDFVCSEALGCLATELGDNQTRIREVGGVKPLVEVLTIPTSQRVYLSAIDTLSKLIMKPALMPNKALQKAVAECRGVSVLASIVCSREAAEIVCVNAACSLALLVLDSPENQKYLTSNTEFSLERVFEFFLSADLTVRIQAGQCLATMAFNNPSMLQSLRQCHPIDISFYTPFLESTDESFQACAGYQLVVLSRMLTGVGDVEAAVRGIRLLVRLLSSEVESTQIKSTEFIASLAHSSTGIPETIVMAGALDHLVSNLTSGSGPVVENSCVALGHLSFHPMPARMMTGMFRERPEKFEVFREYSASIAHSQKFMRGWEEEEKAGLPVLR